MVDQALYWNTPAATDWIPVQPLVPSWLFNVQHHEGNLKSDEAIPSSTLITSDRQKSRAPECFPILLSNL
jgi:hypothetical protein